MIEVLVQVGGSGFGWAEPAINVGAGLAGAAIGGAATLIAVKQQAKIAEAQRKTAASEHVRSMLKAIDSEIAHLFARYEAQVAQLIRGIRPGQWLNFIWPVGEGYFIVYETSAGTLGLVEDDQLRGLIIETYSNAKGLLDSIRLNAAMAKEHGELLPRLGAGVSLEEIQASELRLVTYAEGIVDIDRRLSQSVAALRAAIANATA